MTWIRWFAVCIIMAAALPTSVRACPLCAEAIASSNAAEDDKDDFPAAMNQSIYLMLGVTYLAFGTVGFMIYRGVRQNEAYLQSLQESDSPPQADPV
ncbi:MAG: hypothetical protein FJ303_25450 [Planctomycetes bacterium]|nr:hypothetical protein [Planctomycetota bacterium]